jgi:hypothetical protein
MEFKSDVPGPGHYEANSSAIKDKSPSYKISRSTRTSIVEKILQTMPGPGSYA